MIHLSKEPESGMTCGQAQLLMVPVWVDDPGLTQQQRDAFEAHVAACPACREDYEETQWLISTLRKHKPVAENAREILPLSVGSVVARGSGGQDLHPMTDEQGWEDLKRRCPSLAEACRWQEREKELRRVAWRIGTLAAAACILIAISIGWLTLRNSNPGQSASRIAINSNGSSDAFAELVTDQGRKPLALNRPMATADQPQEILLGGMHRVVMNRNTKATFAAAPALTRGDAPQDGKVPYEIQLAQGELYVEVVPGHPFTVRTGNARLDITGTKFDVLAGDDKTELVLLKGSVRFSQAAAADKFVDVIAGHASAIIGPSAPSVPRETDALATTAWARGLALTNAIARIQPDADLHLLDSIRDYWPQPKPKDLDSIDYAKWRDDHREWFVREFPWTFKVQQVLKEQRGIEADYVELSMISGDIWQFNYPRPRGEPIPVFSAAGIKRIAAHYGTEPTGLLASVAPGAVDALPNQSLANAAGQYQAALRLWHSDIAALSTGVREAKSENRRNDLLMFTLRAATYLNNTRTAAWLWTREHPEKAAALLKLWQESGVGFFDSEDVVGSAQLSDHLQQDVAAAEGIGQMIPDLIVAPEGTGGEEQTTALSAQLAKAIEALLTRGRGVVPQ
jgi:hypothetical protein